MQHRLHLVGFHHLCPWPPCPRADILASIHLSDSSLAKGGQFSMSPGGQFPLSRDRRGWPEYELDGLVTRTVSGEQVLLPII